MPPLLLELKPSPTLTKLQRGAECGPYRLPPATVRANGSGLFYAYAALPLFTFRKNSQCIPFQIVPSDFALPWTPRHCSGNSGRRETLLWAGTLKN